MPLVIDPSKDGLEKVLRDYQIETLRLVWKHDGGGLTSREVYEAVNERLDGGRSVSRASIINFLNTICDEGVLDFEEETCKGGMRRRYRKGMDESAFKKHVASTVLRSLIKDFPEQTVEAIKSNLDAESLRRLHD
jgi:hypothetical protein